MYISVRELKKNPKNPRIIKDDDFQKLKESLGSKKGKRFFEARPCIVSTRTGENIIIAGNTRYQAAIELGWESVPVDIIDGLTKKEENEIIIRDNVNNGNFDWDMLSDKDDWDKEELADWGCEIPSYNEIDYSILDEDKEELQKEIDDIYSNTKKAIVLDFDLEVYEEVFSLNKKLKAEGVNTSLLFLDALRNYGN